MPDAAQRYHRLQLVLGLAALALTVASLVTLLLTGAATALDRAGADGHPGHANWHVARSCRGLLAWNGARGRGRGSTTKAAGQSLVGTKVPLDRG